MRPLAREVQSLLRINGIMMGITWYRPSLRAWGAIGVLTAWVGSLAWLGVRELGQNERSTITAQASLRLAPGAAWFALYAGEVQVGSAGITLDTLSPGYRVLQTVTLEIPGESGLIRATRRTQTRLASTLELIGVDDRSGGAGRQTVWVLTPRGDTLTARYTSGADSAKGTAHFGGPIATAGAFPYRLALSGALASGNRRTPILVAGWPPAGRSTMALVGKDSTIRFADSSAADPASGRLVAVHFDSVKAFPVVFDGPYGPERLWVDRGGSIAGIETVFGLRWQRQDFDLAVQEFRRLLPQAQVGIRRSLPVLTALVSHPDADGSAGERRFRVEHRDGRPIDRTLLSLLSGGRQSVHGDTILVRREIDVSQAGGFDGLPGDPMIQDDAVEIELLGSRFRAIGPSRRSFMELADLLRRLVRIDTSVAAPFDAVGALQARRAQPDGFVRLYVAVLRASGVSARMVVGVLPGGDALRTHAWVEVREPGGAGWLAIDPILGRLPASPALIRLSYGGSSRPEDMLALLADVRFIDLGQPEILP